MLYLLSQFRDIFSPLNLFQYISFRAGGAFLTALILFLVCGKPFIGMLKHFRIRQDIREYGPSSHLSKAGTPTMGGLLILLTMVGSTLLWARLDNRFVWMTLLSAVLLGLLGLFDDYQKWLKRHPAKGLSDRVKLAVQLVYALFLGSYLYFYPSNSSYAHMVNIPYLKDVYIHLGSFYIFFAFLVMVGASNGVNLTDGLDGLAAGTIIICAISFAILAYLAGHMTFSSYLRLIPVSGAGELSIYLAAMAGACMGFLWYNAHPAEIFMGDTGSLFLGGSLGVVALCIKQELILIVVGGIFVAEAFSVLLQIGSVRFRNGKRLFRMAPLHHHFEMGGIPEVKVTVRFWIVAVILSLVAMTSLKIR